MNKQEIKTDKKIESLKAKVAKQTEKLKNEFHAICEQLNYQDSSRFSYNIDRLEAFNNELQEFKMFNK